MSNLAIWNFAQELDGLLDAKDDAQNDAERAEIDTAIDALAGDIAKKTDGYAEFLSRSDAELERLNQEIFFLEAKQKRIKARATWIRLRLLEFMKAQELPKLAGDNHCFTIRQNPPAVNITDESALPSKYVTWDLSKNINKRAIAEALKTGEVPGAELTRGERLERR